MKKKVCNKLKSKPKSKTTKKTKKTINVLSKNKNIISVSGGGGGGTIPIPIPIFNNEGSRPVIIQQPYETIQQPVYQPIKDFQNENRKPFYTLEDKPASLNIFPEKKKKSPEKKVDDTASLTISPEKKKKSPEKKVDNTAILNIFPEKKVDDTSSVKSEPVIKKKRGRPLNSRNKPKPVADVIPTTQGFVVPESPIPQNLSPVRRLRSNPIVAGQSDIDFYKQNRNQIEKLIENLR